MAQREWEQRQAAKRAIVAAALAEGRSYSEIAALADVGVRTIGRWRQDPEFEAEVTSLREQRVSLIVGQLTELFADSAGMLREALHDPDPRVRLKAIELTGEMLARFRTNPRLEERVRRLEAETEEGPR